MEIQYTEFNLDLFSDIENFSSFPKFLTTQKNAGDEFSPPA
jgi:hypothetical protein